MQDSLSCLRTHWAPPAIFQLATHCCDAAVSGAARSYCGMYKPDPDPRHCLRTHEPFSQRCAQHRCRASAGHQPVSTWAMTSSSSAAPDQRPLGSASKIDHRGSRRRHVSSTASPSAGNAGPGVLHAASAARGAEAPLPGCAGSHRHAPLLRELLRRQRAHGPCAAHGSQQELQS